MKLIKPNINIKRPLVFLCGPYYEDKKYDRRKILKDFLNCEDKAIPIIVDKFLDKKKINDDTVNIDLIEEICAAVSYKTYIFLDTFSSVAELGMFCSSVYKNEIDIFIPKKTDIVNNNIGYFVNEIIENDNNQRIKCLYYRPKIVRVPLASDYVTEFYEFTNDELPDNIKTRLKSDEVYKMKNYNLIFDKDSITTEKTGVICYSEINSKITFNISVRTLFYLVASILLEKSNQNEDEIQDELKKLLINSFCFYESRNISEFTQVQISTKILQDIKVIIKHILVFIKLYNQFGESKGRNLITKSDNLIYENNVYIGIPSVYNILVNQYIKNPDNYIEIIKIKRGKKLRSITKYKDDENGNKLRKLHQIILNNFQQIYYFSENSYAYRKGFSILDCTLPHRNSSSFLSLDIKSFFNSVNYAELYKYTQDIGDSFVLGRDFKKILKACMYRNKLPLGLVTSPILSDIYLHNFDKNIINLLNELNKEVIFTRYADDMFFSCKEKMEEGDIDYIIGSVKEELKKIKLEINKEKIVIKNLLEFGSYIKILGINIVKYNNNNQVTVGKKFINDTSKMLLEFLKLKLNNKLSDESEFYTQKRLTGRLAYINQIEGDYGVEKLRRRVRKSVNFNKEISLLDHKTDWDFLLKFDDEIDGENIKIT